MKKESNKKKGRMAALQDLRGVASKMMGSDMGELRKVTVAAKDTAGLKKGLDTAEKMLGGKKEKMSDDYMEKMKKRKY